MGKLAYNSQFERLPADLQQELIDAECQAEPTPTPTETPIPPTVTATPTKTPLPPTPTPTDTAAPATPTLTGTPEPPTFTLIPADTPTATSTPQPTPTIALERTGGSVCEIEDLKWSYQFGVLTIEGSATCDTAVILFRLYDGVGSDAQFLGTIQRVIDGYAILGIGMNIPKVEYIAFKYSIEEF